MNRTVLQVFMREFVRGTGLFGLGFLFGIRRHRTGQDFLSLFGLGAIIITIVAFSSSAGRGITENLTNAMLGNIRGAGAPIWVLGHPENGFVVDPTFSGVTLKGGKEERPEPRFYPVTEIEPNDFLIKLPDKDIWATISQSKDTSTEVRGWAISRDNPVWRQYADENASISTVILSRSLFEQYFQYPKYREALAKVLPATALQQVPETVNDFSTLKQIYLSLPFQDNRRRLVKFDIRWVDSLPALQKIAFIVPEDIVSLGSAVRSNSGIGLAFPSDVDQYDKPYQILTGVTFRGMTTSRFKKALEERGGDKIFDDLLKCVGPSATMERDGGRLSIKWKEVVDRKDVYACLSTANMDKLPNFSPAHSPVPELVAQGSIVETTCQALSNANRLIAEPPACTDGKVKYIPNPHVRSGLFFVPSNEDIAAHLDTIKGYRDGKNRAVFIIGENYLDALGRMDFTKKVISYLTAVMAVLGLVLCVVVLYLQMRPMVSRRAASYGLLLARGMSPVEIYAGFFIQILATVLVSALVAVLLYIGIRVAIEHWFQSSDAAIAARKGIGLLEVRLIPVSDDGGAIFGIGIKEIISSTLLGLVTTAIIMIACGFGALFRLPLRRRSLPISLIAGGSTAPIIKDEGEKSGK